MVGGHVTFLHLYRSRSGGKTQQAKITTLWKDSLAQLQIHLFEKASVLLVTSPTVFRKRKWFNKFFSFWCILKGSTRNSTLQEGWTNCGTPDIARVQFSLSSLPMLAGDNGKWNSISGEPNITYYFSRLWLSWEIVIFVQFFSKCIKSGIGTVRFWPSLFVLSSPFIVTVNLKALRN